MKLEDVLNQALAQVPEEHRGMVHTAFCIGAGAAGMLITDPALADAGWPFRLAVLMEQLQGIKPRKPLAEGTKS